LTVVSTIVLVSEVVAALILDLEAGILYKIALI
jgi:hypothetical protein